MSHLKKSRYSMAEQWFGHAFKDLHPQLQQLHREGGALEGSATLTYGKGLAGFLGRRIAKKLALPRASGVYPFCVAIGHDKSSLIWARTFNGHSVTSVFKPVGKYPDGYWIEKTGFVTLALGVNIIGGGWYWQRRGVRIWGVPIAQCLQPTMHANKTCENHHYQFSVAFSWGRLGELFCYKGSLTLGAEL